MHEPPASANVVWDHGGADRSDRARWCGRSGLTVWLTGLPASGKSTLAKAVEARLVEEGRLAYRLDGDNLRHGLCGDLGFSTADREENVRRAGHVALLMADAGLVSVVALVSPQRAARDRVRAQHEAEGLAFVEVFVDTPLAECERRDPKGLYARARAGGLETMTGVDGGYEPPTAPELRIAPPWEVAEAVDAVRALVADGAPSPAPARS